MKKSIVSIIVVLGLFFGVTSVYASEVTEAVVGAAKAVETGVEQVVDDVSSGAVRETVVYLGGTLNDALKGIITSAATAKDFMVGQTPLVVKELLKWKLIESLIGVLLGLIIGGSMCVGVTWLFLRITKSFQEDFGTAGLDYVILIVGNITGIFTTWVTFELTWLQIWVAPKVYLIEYAAELIK